MTIKIQSHKGDCFVGKRHASSQGLFEGPEIASLAQTARSQGLDGINEIATAVKYTARNDRTFFSVLAKECICLLRLKQSQLTPLEWNIERVPAPPQIEKEIATLRSQGLNGMNEIATLCSQGQGSERLPRPQQQKHGLQLQDFLFRPCEGVHFVFCDGSNRS